MAGLQQQGDRQLTGGGGRHDQPRINIRPRWVYDRTRAVLKASNWQISGQAVLSRRSNFAVFAAVGHMRPDLALPQLGFQGIRSGWRPQWPAHPLSTFVLLR
jgi:hypothetical protein